MLFIGFLNYFFLFCLICFLGLRYKIEGDFVFRDSFTYFLILMGLYLGVSNIEFLFNRKSLVGASFETIKFSISYSIYFMYTILFYAVYRFLFLKKNKFKSSSCIKIIAINKNVLFLIYSFVLLYIFVFFFYESPGVLNMWLSRRVASDFNTYFTNTYKISFLFNVVVSIVLYLSIRYKTLSYLILFLPFVVMNLLTTDRNYLYQVLLIWLFISAIIGRSIPVLKVLTFSLFIMGLAVIRANWMHGFDFAMFFSTPGELFLTKEAEFMILGSSLKIDFLKCAAMSLGKVFTPQLMSALFGGAYNFREIINIESMLHFGLGGSLLSEVFSFKNNYIYFLYPFITIGCLEFYNFLYARFNFFGMLIFLNFIYLTHSVFRSGIIFSMTDPVYYAMYGGLWYWVSKFVISRSDNYIECEIVGFRSA